MSREKDALASAFASLHALARHGITPSQKRIATEAAGVCLWGLGVDEFDGIKANRPVVRAIDAEPTTEQIR